MGQFIAPVIVLAIKIWFFIGVDSYSLGRKLHTSYFFSLFCGEMIRVICAILAIAIENLELHCKNKNPSIKKSTIWFEPYVYNYKTGKYFVFFNGTLILIIVFKGICSTWEDIGRDTFRMSRLYFGNSQETGSQVSSWGGKEKSEILAIPN